MNAIKGESVSKNPVEEFDADEVLCYFDGPRICTLKDTRGKLYLAYWTDTDGTLNRYVVVPTNPKTIKELKEKKVDLLTALQQSKSWVLDVTGHDIISCISVTTSDLPVDALPAAGVMLIR